MAVEARVESLERKLDHALKLLGSLETSTLGAVSAAARPPPPVDEYGGGTLSALRKAMEQTQPALKSLEEIPVRRPLPVSQRPCRAASRHAGCRLTEPASQGPGAVNITEYNARNHRYLTELHEEYGDIYTMQVPGSVARAASGGDDNAVIFVRAPDDVRSVLTSESFGKTWGVAEDATTNTVSYPCPPPRARQPQPTTHRRARRRPAFQFAFWDPEARLPRPPAERVAVAG